MYLAIEFQEEYKRLDRLCKDLLCANEGVSEYIRQMEATARLGQYYVRTWDEDYKQLKHVRYVRNRLAHDVGTLTSDVCTQEDLAWIKCFYQRILSGDDPFAVLRKGKAAQARQAKPQERITMQKTVGTPQSPREAPSLWEKFVTAVKKLFE